MAADLNITINFQMRFNSLKNIDWSDSKYLEEPDNTSQLRESKRN
jgi:hypothetical protein